MGERRRAPLGETTMVGKRDTHTDPELDFGDLNEDATGEFTRKKPSQERPAESPPRPIESPAQPPAPTARPTRPAPHDSLDAWTSSKSSGRGRALDDLEFAAPPANHVAPDAAPAAVDEDSADEELFGTKAAGGNGPTRRAPSEYPKRTPTQPMAVAPPPKLPTLPDIEFTMGLPPAESDDLPPVLSAASADDWSDLATPVKTAAAGAIEPAETFGEPLIELEDPVVGEPGDAHSLVERANSLPPGAATPDPQREMSERFALGDFSGALVVAEAMLVEQSDQPDALRVASECRAKLQSMYLSRLGPMDQVPTLSLPRAELKWLSLDHRAGFVLSLVDGVSSMEEIIDVAGMPMLEVLRVLFDLHNQRAIEFKRRR